MVRFESHQSDPIGLGQLRANPVQPLVHGHHRSLRQPFICRTGAAFF